MKYRILLIEDEEDLLTVLSYNLQKEGYIVETATTGQKGLDICFASPPDLLLLDLNLPDMSGLEICSRLREKEDTAKVCIIMLTAKSAENERVSGFEAGADDYVPKPFNTRELLLRIRAQLRRVPEKKSNVLEVGNIRIDIDQHRCSVEGKEIDLTALEFRLLQKFLEEKERVQSRELLLKEVWNMDPRINTRTVDKHVQRLRSKLGNAGDCIQTIRGVGYRMKT